jgi:hypothetical protein
MRTWAFLEQDKQSLKRKKVTFHKAQREQKWDQRLNGKAKQTFVLYKSGALTQLLAEGTGFLPREDMAVVLESRWITGLEHYQFYVV